MLSRTGNAPPPFTPPPFARTSKNVVHSNAVSAATTTATGCVRHSNHRHADGVDLHIHYLGCTLKSDSCRRSKSLTLPGSNCDTRGYFSLVHPDKLPVGAYDDTGPLCITGCFILAYLVVPFTCRNDCTCIDAKPSLASRTTLERYYDASRNCNPCLEISTILTSLVTFLWSDGRAYPCIRRLYLRAAQSKGGGQGGQGAWSQ